MKPNTKEVYIYPDMSISVIKGKYAWNDNWKVGGIIGNGNERGIEIGGSWYSTCTGDCLYDSLVINGFKVYEIENDHSRTNK